MSGYVSQDPIKLFGGTPTLYSYIHNSNLWLDIYGLSLGGGYNGTRSSMNGGEVNHIPAWNSIEIAKKANPKLKNMPTYGTTPAIHMDTPDHRNMSSTGSSNKAKIYREKQAKLINEGEFYKAMEMDIDETIRKYGTKYNQHIDEMLDYAESKGYISNVEKQYLKNKHLH